MERIDCQMRKEMNRCLITLVVMAVVEVATPFLGWKSAVESDMVAVGSFGVFGGFGFFIGLR